MRQLGVKVKSENVVTVLFFDKLNALWYDLMWDNNISLNFKPLQNLWQCKEKKNVIIKSKWEKDCHIQHSIGDGQ